jgi:hypothetical protein
MKADKTLLIPCIPQICAAEAGLRPSLYPWIFLGILKTIILYIWVISGISKDTNRDCQNLKNQELRKASAFPPEIKGL